MAKLAQLVASIKERKCILFLGAGVHYPPPPTLTQYSYPPEVRPPLGSALSEALVEDSRRLMQESFLDTATAESELPQSEALENRQKLAFLEKHKTNLQRTSWYYEVEHERKALVDFVNGKVSAGKEPSAILRALVEIDFPIVITTNYDQLFEVAQHRWNAAHPDRARTLRSSIYDPRPEALTEEYLHVPAPNERWFFKIHGCVSKPESIVITDEDYIKFIMRMNAAETHQPIPARIRALLSEWTTLFVGYSLLDYNLRLLFRTLRWHLEEAIRPLTFSVDLKPDYLIRSTYEKRALVSFIAHDIWILVPELYRRVLEKPMDP